MTSFQYQSITAPTTRDHLSTLAALRIKIFREYPYLYDGTLDYETKYLETYFKAPNSMVTLCKDGDKIIGASTCVPLSAEEESFKKPFIDHKMNLNEILYFGESLLLPEYRGQGIGKQLLALREKHALALNMRYCVFCAVVRDASDVLRPSNYRNPEALWIAQGYRPLQGVTTTYMWKQIEETTETEKLMQFWIKDLQDPVEKAKRIVQSYFDGFLQQSKSMMIASLSEDVAHDINEGDTEIGKDKFSKFMDVMFKHYQETIEDMIIMVSADGKRASAEYFVVGNYIETYPGLPVAKNQKYRSRIVSVFEIEKEKIKRVTTRYNLKDWIRSVS